MFGEVKTELLKGGWVSRDVTNNKHAEQGKQSKMLYKQNNIRSGLSTTRKEAHIESVSFSQVFHGTPWNDHE